MATGRSMLLKVIVLGDSGVGDLLVGPVSLSFKTFLIYRRYVCNQFSLQHEATIGTDFLTKEIQIGDEKVILQLWDTAVQARQSLDVFFFRGADCCVLVYDVNVSKSFDSLQYWHQEFLKQASPSDPKTFPFVVLGNKVDMDGGSSRVVSEKEAADWCASNGNIPYFETSAKEDYNVDEAFFTIAKIVVANEHEQDKILSEAEEESSTWCFEGCEETEEVNVAGRLLP